MSKQNEVRKMDIFRACLVISEYQFLDVVPGHKCILYFKHEIDVRSNQLFHFGNVPNLN